MNPLDNVKNNIEKHIINFFKTKGLELKDVQFDRTANQEFGDFSTNAVMKNAKPLSTNPVELGEELVLYLSSKNILYIEKVQFVKPGFINFYLNENFLSRFVSNVCFYGKEFGKNDSLKGQKWIVEHTSPNPNKAMHLGHLRNNLIGMGILRLLDWSGADTTADCVYNNRGIAIAKVMYGFLSHMLKNKEAEVIKIDKVLYWKEHKNEWFTPEEKGMKPDNFITECYIMGETYFQASKSVEQYTRDLVVRWEANEKEVWELWSHVLDYAYQGINRTLNRIGNRWDKIWYEHEHYQNGKEYIEKGLESGVFKKLEDGAILTDFSSYKNIPDTILLKNDGTSLYITQDIALTSLKKNTYNADKLVWVIGPEQSLAMKQLFAACEQLKIGKFEDFTHIPYGYVGLKDEDGSFKKMSSRAGTVVLIDDVLDVVRDAILNRETKNPELNTPELAEKLALGAVKFSILKSDKIPDLAFDVKQSVDVTGDSGVYVMYTYVRTQSILKKYASKNSVLKKILNKIKNSKSQPLGHEKALIRNLMFFPDVIKRATDDLSVHHVAQYLLEVCSEFNSWYAKEVILDGTSKEASRIELIRAVGIIIQNGLNIIGIDTVDEM